jgi:hypothetical protein
MSNVARKLAGDVGRLLLAYLLIFSQSAWAAQDTKPTDTAKPAQKAAVEREREKPSSAVDDVKAQPQDVQGELSENAASAEKLPGDGKHEGIKVHGHWTIEVKNPDGTVVTHREFENSLVQTNLLSSILSRNASVGYWAIALTGSGVTSPYVVYEPIGLSTIGTYDEGLSVTTNGNNVVLTGATVPAFGSLGISTVQTFMGSCPPPSVASSCQACHFTPDLVTTTVPVFTQATLSTPIQVLAGQTIAVMVVISFS